MARSLVCSAPVTAREEALQAVAAHCDLLERLPLIPPSARLRGLYYGSIETVLKRAGCVDQYRALCPEHFSAIRFYSVSDFLVHLTIGASVLMSPERVHEGMFEIGRRNAIAVSESLIGRALLRLLSRDPQKLLQQGVAARRQSFTYGDWELSFPEPQTAVMTIAEEYVYIESYLLGAARGTFDAISLPVRTEVILEDRFNGRHVLRW